MSCPTCDHTMHALGNRHFWCPRCGTLRHAVSHDWKDDSCPMLVRRVRTLLDGLDPSDRDTARALGIFESIHQPDRRPES